jgi:hypothetical protein
MNGRFSGAKCNKADMTQVAIQIHFAVFGWSPAFLANFEPDT